MCGISGIIGPQEGKRERLLKMVHCLHYRGPDAAGAYFSPDGQAALGHNRLSIIDLSDAGKQPMSDPSGRYWLVFNGELYNYLEIRQELGGDFRTETDSEVLLAAYLHWGEMCLEHFVGMFAFAIWDEKEQTLFAARDRFGVKPFYYSFSKTGCLFFASEIKGIHAAGVLREMDPTTWATYLCFGLYEHSERTFWKDIYSLSPGHILRWKNGKIDLRKWYDLAERVPEQDDSRSISVVKEEYRELLMESVRLRFRADVPVGINLSGGLDSSTLLGLVHAVQGEDSSVKAFTFITGDERYDELPWVEQMLAQTRHPHCVSTLTVEEIPDLAHQVQIHQDEPFGGIPTLAYAKIFQMARQEGVIVLLDGQGIDEQWAGYEYYMRVSDDTDYQQVLGPVQGSQSRSTCPECLMPNFRDLAQPLASPQVFRSALQNMQYRDVRYTKIPRALRFNDRISMMFSTELREPFLDHRLFELALRQPRKYKIRGETQKWLLREIAQDLLPQGIVTAPKRPVQTPQREWLRENLKSWATDCIEHGLSLYGGMWLDTAKVRSEWEAYQRGVSDNSFYIWQWISLGLVC